MDIAESIAGAVSERTGQGIRVLFEPEVGSTNSALKRMIASGRLDGPAILFAGHQTAGRGTRGRSWFQPPPPPGKAGQDVAISLATPQDRSSLRDPRLSLATAAIAAAAIEDAVSNLPDKPMSAFAVGVSWPNDLLAGAGGEWRKVGGILIETVGPGKRRPGDAGQAPAERWLIIGIGVNVNSRRSDYPPELAGSLTTIASELGTEVDLGIVQTALAVNLVSSLLGEMDIGALMQDWMRRDRTTGTLYTLMRDGQAIEVTARRINPSTGYLVCSDEQGKEYTVRSYRELEKKS